MLNATAFAIVLLAGCKPAQEPAAQPSAPATAAAAAFAPATPASSGAPSDAEFIAIGTEPFWNLKIAGDKAIYTTPEDQNGQTLAVAATQDGSSRQFNGTLAGQPFELKLRIEACSDGMSERSYRYAADLAVAGEARQGCAEPGIAFKPE